MIVIIIKIELVKEKTCFIHLKWLNLTPVVCASESCSIIFSFLNTHYTNYAPSNKAQKWEKSWQQGFLDNEFTWVFTAPLRKE